MTLRLLYWITFPSPSKIQTFPIFIATLLALKICFEAWNSVGNPPFLDSDIWHKEPENKPCGQQKRVKSGQEKLKTFQSISTPISE